MRGSMLYQRISIWDFLIYTVSLVAAVGLWVAGLCTDNALLMWLAVLFGFPVGWFGFKITDPVYTHED